MITWWIHYASDIVLSQALTRAATFAQGRTSQRGFHALHLVQRQRNSSLHALLTTGR